MTVSLTALAAKGGCACKIGPHILDKVLQGVSFPSSPNVMVNMSGADDAGVYKLTDDMALVQTVDFFTPMVDDATLYGKISACNSLSDIYAMGGTPISALNIVAFPVPLVEQGLLTAALEGANSVLKEANVALLGGHSVENEVPLYGMAVTGLINPRCIWTNDGAQVGDVLILTKPLGTGIMNTALKGGLFEEGTAEAVKSMSTLNRISAEAGQHFTVHACTDITGFSLMGHTTEMATGSGVSICIDTSKLPLFTGTYEAAEMGLVPASSYGNRKAIPNVNFEDTVTETWKDICYDPQTSGGLLFSVPVSESEDFIAALQEAGSLVAVCIGEVVAQKECPIYVK